MLGLYIDLNEYDKPAYGILINGEGEVEEAITLPYFRYTLSFPAFNVLKSAKVRTSRHEITLLLNQ